MGTRKSRSSRAIARGSSATPGNEVSYIYGKHAAREAVANRPDIIREAYLAESFAADDIVCALQTHGVQLRVLNEKNPPRGISSKAAHQGVVLGIQPARLLRSYRDFMTGCTFTPDTAFLLLQEVQDPHNVGAVIRSAAAFGLAGVLIPPHNQAPITGSVVKVSAGMAFRIPLVEIRNVNATIRDLQQRGCWVYGLAGEGGVTTHTEQFDRPTVFVLGNEHEGLREKTRTACDALLRIPLHTRCESLNAAAATAVVLATWSAQHPSALSVPGE
ncbi:MAG: 23S rRNA (guanosine(2251)-2'-O)-methyltransferase RlmB [Patescibacteria group bacterium]